MFDLSQNATYQGVVKEYRLENPHSHLVITVGPDAKQSSTAGTWDIEASSINIMVGEGLESDDVQTRRRNYSSCAPDEERFEGSFAVLCHKAGWHAAVSRPTSV